MQPSPRPSIRVALPANSASSHSLLTVVPSAQAPPSPRAPSPHGSTSGRSVSGAVAAGITPEMLTKAMQSPEANRALQQFLKERIEVNKSVANSRAVSPTHMDSPSAANRSAAGPSALAAFMQAQQRAESGAPKGAGHTTEGSPPLRTRQGSISKNIGDAAGRSPPQPTADPQSPEVGARNGRVVITRAHEADAQSLASALNAFELKGPGSPNAQPASPGSPGGYFFPPPASNARVPGTLAELLQAWNVPVEPALLAGGPRTNRPITPTTDVEDRIEREAAKRRSRAVRRDRRSPRARSRSPSRSAAAEDFDPTAYISSSSERRRERRHSRSSLPNPASAYGPSLQKDRAYPPLPERPVEHMASAWENAASSRVHSSNEQYTYDPSVSYSTSIMVPPSERPPAPNLPVPPVAYLSSYPPMPASSPDDIQGMAPYPSSRVDPERLDRQLQHTFDRVAREAQDSAAALRSRWQNLYQPQPAPAPHLHQYAPSPYLQTTAPAPLPMPSLSAFPYATPSLGQFGGVPAYSTPLRPGEGLSKYAASEPQSPRRIAFLARESDPLQALNASLGNVLSPSALHALAPQPASPHVTFQAPPTALSAPPTAPPQSTPAPAPAETEQARDKRLIETVLTVLNAVREKEQNTSLRSALSAPVPSQSAGGTPVAERQTSELRAPQNIPESAPTPASAPAPIQTEMRPSDWVKSLRSRPSPSARGGKQNQWGRDTDGETKGGDSPRAPSSRSVKDMLQQSHDTLRRLERYMDSIRRMPPIGSVGSRERATRDRERERERGRSRSRSRERPSSAPRSGRLVRDETRDTLATVNTAYTSGSDATLSPSERTRRHHRRHSSHRHAAHRLHFTDLDGDYSDSLRIERDAYAAERREQRRRKEKEREKEKQRQLEAQRALEAKAQEDREKLQKEVQYQQQQQQQAELLKQVQQQQQLLSQQQQQQQQQSAASQLLIQEQLFARRRHDKEESQRKEFKTISKLMKLGTAFEQLTKLTSPHAAMGPGYPPAVYPAGVPMAPQIASPLAYGAPQFGYPGYGSPPQTGKPLSAPAYPWPGDPYAQPPHSAPPARIASPQTAFHQPRAQRVLSQDPAGPSRGLRVDTGPSGDQYGSSLMEQVQARRASMNNADNLYSDSESHVASRPAPAMASQPFQAISQSTHSLAPAKEYALHSVPRMSPGTVSSHSHQPAGELLVRSALPNAVSGEPLGAGSGGGGAAPAGEEQAAEDMEALLAQLQVIHQMQTGAGQAGQEPGPQLAPQTTSDVVGLGGGDQPLVNPQVQLPV